MKSTVVTATLIVCSLLLLFRFWLAVNAKHGDMYNNLDWGTIAVDRGLSGFYDLPKTAFPHSRPNQPAGSIYLHAASILLDRAVMRLTYRINTAVSVFPSPLVWWWEWNGSLVTIKFFSIMADFIIAAVILSFARHFHSLKIGVLAALAYLANPALWYNSAFWGQTDSVVAALALISISLLFFRRPFLSVFFLALSLITKASWAPLLPLYGLYLWRTDRRHLWALGLIPAVLLLGFLPFHPHLDIPQWTASLYTHRILPGESAFITVLAFNFWNLIFGPYGVPHTTPLWGIPANLIGWFLVGLAALLLGIRLVKRPTIPVFIWASALLFFAVFLFAPKMIHRYLYPVFPLFYLSLVTTSHRRLLAISLLVISALYLVNIYSLWCAPGIDWLKPFYTPQLMQFISLAYLAVFGILFVRRGSYAKN